MNPVITAAQDSVNTKYPAALDTIYSAKLIANVPATAIASADNTVETVSSILFHIPFKLLNLTSLNLSNTTIANGCGNPCVHPLNFGLPSIKPIAAEVAHVYVPLIHQTLMYCKKLVTHP